MGIDARPLGNHKLDTSSLAALAADLSERLDAQVTYGYQSHHKPYDHVVLGIAGAGKPRQVTLRKDNHLHNHRDQEGAARLQFECSGFDDGTGCEVWVNIYKDCFEAPYYFIGRWGWYHRTFTGEHDDWDYMLEYRRKIQEEITLMGGDMAVISPDSSYHELYHPDPYLESFSAIAERIKTEPNFLDVSAWLRDDDAPFPENPLLFFDDFSYWPTVEPMMERARRWGKLKPRK